MKRPLVVAVLVGLLSLPPRSAGALFAPVGPPLQTYWTDDGREAVVGRVLVGFIPQLAEFEREDVHRAARNRRASQFRVISGVGQTADEVETASVQDALEAYREDPRVSYVEPEYVHHALGVPNDPDFPRQWGMTQIQAPAAWDVTHGSANVRVAVLDSGIFDEASPRLARDGLPGHPDLRRKVMNRQNFTHDPDADDQFGHGTHVAGIVAADTNNLVGVAGVGYDTRLMNVKVLNAYGSGSEAWIVSGILWATDNGAAVINLSLGATGACSPAMRDAVGYAWAHNVVVVAAAGNTGTSALQTPASCPNVVSVASTDASDARSGSSSFGGWVTVAAPGGYDAASRGVLSTSYLGDYVTMVGTSMAAAHVSGLAALVWSMAGSGASNAAVVSRLVNTADPVSGTGTAWAFGRINAAAAVGAAPPRPPATPTPTPTPTPTASDTPTPTPSGTATPTVTTTDTVKPPLTVTPTDTAKPTVTPTPTYTRTATVAATATATATIAATDTATPTTTASVTATATSTLAPTTGSAVVFQSGFETGSFSGWSGTVEDGQNPVVEVIRSAAYSGAYGAHFFSGTSVGGQRNAAEATRRLRQTSAVVSLQARVRVNSVSGTGTLEVLGLYRRNNRSNAVGRLEYANGQWLLELGPKSGSKNVTSSAFLLALGQWHQLSLSYDATAGQSRLLRGYVDGALVASVTDTDTTSGAVRLPDTVYVGVRETASGASGDVWIDDVSVTQAQSN